MRREEAETTALSALSWLAGEPERLGAFLAASGAAPGDLRQRAGEPEFLGFVLDWILQDEAAVIDFSEAAGLRPETALRARAALPGGDAPDWT